MIIVKGTGLALTIGVSGGSGPLPLDGLRLVAFRVDSDLVDVTGEACEGWRQLLPGAGVRAVELSSRGIFLGSAAEVRLRQLAMTGTAEDYVLSLENGLRLRGRFIVRQLSYGSPHDEELTFDFILASAGPVAIV